VRQNMKFNQNMVPVMLCIMYSATLFGAKFEKKVTLSDLGPDIYGLIDEFAVDLYKETAHIKPYPFFLRKVLSYHYQQGNYGGPEDGMFEIANPNYALVAIFFQGSYSVAVSMMYIGVGAILFPFLSKPVAYKMFFTGSSILFLGETFRQFYTRVEIYGRLYEKIINRLFKSRTYIESLPLSISVDSDQDSFYVTGSLPVSYIPNSNYYRMECRFLSNMNLRWRRLDQITSSKIEDIKLRNAEPRKKNNWIYKLEDGEINIYRGELNFKLKNKMSSLPTKEEVTAFDVSKDGKIIVTGSKDGIRKWELQEAKKLETILEEE